MLTLSPSAEPGVRVRKATSPCILRLICSHWSSNLREDKMGRNELETVEWGESCGYTNPRMPPKLRYVIPGLRAEVCVRVVHAR